MDKKKNNRIKSNNLLKTANCQWFLLVNGVFFVVVCFVFCSDFDVSFNRKLYVHTNPQTIDVNQIVRSKDWFLIFFFIVVVLCLYVCFWPLSEKVGRVKTNYQHNTCTRKWQSTRKFTMCITDLKKSRPHLPSRTLAHNRKQTPAFLNQFFFFLFLENAKQRKPYSFNFFECLVPCVTKTHINKTACDRRSIK